MIFFKQLTRRLNRISSSRRASVAVVLLLSCLIALGSGVIHRMIRDSMADREKHLTMQVRRTGKGIERRYRDFIEDLTGFAAAGLFDNFQSVAGTDARRLIPLKRFYARHQDRISGITVRSRDNTWVSLSKSRDNYYTLEKGTAGNGGEFFSKTPKVIWERDQSHYVEPVRNALGEVSYCVVVTTDLSRFFASELSGLYPGPDTWLWVMDTDGGITLVVNSERPDRTLTDFSMENIEPILADTREEYQGRMEHDAFFGRPARVLSAYFPLRLGGRVFGLVFSSDTGTLYGGLKRATFALCIIFGFILLLSLFVFYRILHQRRLSQQATGEALLLRKSVLDAASLISIIAVDTEGKITVFNRGAEKMLGYAADDLLGKGIVETIHLEPEIRALTGGAAAPFRALVERNVNRGEDWVCTYVAKGGKRITVNQTTTAITDPSGRVTGYLGVAQDITERLEHQKQLEESEKRLQTMLDSLMVGVVLVDVKGHSIRYINPVGADMVGLPREEIIGEKCLSFFCPSAVTGCPLKGSREKLENLEVFLTRSDGSQIPVMKTVTPVAVDGNPHYLESFIDITLRKAAEEEIRRQRSLLDSLIDSIPDLIFFKDTEGVYLGCNKAFRDFFGLKKESVTGLTDHDLFPRNLADRIRKQDLTVPREMKPVAAEEWTHHADGRRVLLEILKTPYIDTRGNPLGLVGICRDITLKKRTEEALSSSEARFRLITQSANDAILTFDADFCITFWNRGAETIFGYTESEILGKPMLTLVPDRQKKSFRKVMAYMGRTGRHPFDGKTIERPARTKDGREIAIEISLATWETAGERFTSQVIRDISLRKQAEEERENAKQAAEEANRAKSDFLARMSHEIRTPMNAIIGMSHLLLESELDPPRHDYMSKILSSANTLLGIINDILDFSKIEAGKMKVEAVPFDLDDVLCNLSDFTGLRADEKGLEVLFAFGRDVPRTLVGDPLRLGQVLINLLGNAIKFTEKGEIIVRTELRETGETHMVLGFSISDTGIGLTEKEKRSLFQAFSQADGSTTRKYGGTGLGLSICRKLVEMMGGSIEVTSRKGVGSTFTFTARFGRSKTPSAPPPHMPEKLPNTLLVDDNPAARRILKEVLTALSLPVTTAASGKEALALLSEPPKKPFELVFLDWKMPETGGVETAAGIRKMAHMQAVPLILMVSAHDREEVDLPARRAGINGYLLKPVCRATLLESLPSYLGTSPRPAPNGERRILRVSPEMEKIRGASILLVEDNVINQQVARKLMEKFGIRVTVAGNGREGVKTALEEDFSLVLMDIQMPEMDGLTAAKRIREGGKKKLPIIAMTANAMEGDRGKSIDAGMNDHITKPIDPNLLYGTLIRWIVPRGRDPLSENRAGEKEAPEPKIPDLPGINVAKGLMMVGRIPSLYIKMLGRFLDNNLRTEYKLRAALKAGDLKTARHMVHSLKGVAGTVGAGELFDSAENLEREIRGGKVENLPPLVDLFSENLSVVLSGLTVFRKQREKTEPEQSAAPPPVEKEAVAPLLRELSTLLETDLVKAMKKLEEIGGMIALSPLKREFDTLRKQMEGFDTDNARKSLGRIAGLLTISLDGK